MPVETATHISDLVPTNPPGTDPLSQADDHIRLIKSVLQATLPGTGSLAGALVPMTGIIMWSGLIADIPANWALCDGSTVNGILTPDLRDRFIIGAGGSTSAQPGGTGGSTTTSSDGSHDHGAATGGHTLIAAEIPGGNGSAGAGTVIAYTTATPAATQAHTHPISSDGAHTHTVTPPYFALAYIMRVA